MKTNVILAIAFVISVASGIIITTNALFHFLDLDWAMSDVRGHEEELNIFYIISEIELKGEPKASVVEKLQRFKAENPERPITLVVEKDRIVFNATEYVFQDDKLVEVKAVDQN